MPAEENYTKSEAPTPRRRQRAREQGQVAVSGELNSGLVLLAGTLALWLAGHGLATALLATMRWHLLHLHWDRFGPAGAGRLLAWLLLGGLQMLGLTLAVLFLVGFAASLFQSGFSFSGQKLVPRWERISAVGGWQRLWSSAAVVRGLLAVAKAAVVVALAVWVLRGRGSQIAGLGRGSLAEAAAAGWLIALRLALAIAAALVLIGLADYLFQRWKHEQSLRMSRQELKEELKEEEGDPLIRARVRKLQREYTQRRMMQQVPKATVVVTNPTHLAVALRYDRGRMPAPKVVAKGSGHVAKRICELARRHAVPVIERKPLAQALYKAVEVGQEIPAVLYHAVAEVLAYVYRLRPPKQ